MTAQKILMDTSILLEGDEGIIAKLEKVAPVFITDIVLQELDGHKNNSNGSVAYRAREFFRKLGNSNGEALDILPDGMTLEKGDTLRKMFLGDTPLHVIVRKPYKARDINDSKIIEIAKDYNMILVTLDTAQRVRGLSDGVEAVTLASILPPQVLKEEIQMSEIEKLMKKEERRNKKNTMKTLIITTILILIFGSIILSYIATETVFWYFIFGCFVVISSLINIKLGKKGMGWEGKKQDSFETFTDPLYSSFLGNIYHKD